MGFLKALNVNLVVAQIISFLLVLWLMKKYLWKPVFAVLEELQRRRLVELAPVSIGLVRMTRSPIPEIRKRLQRRRAGRHPFSPELVERECVPGDVEQLVVPLLLPVLE